MRRVLTLLIVGAVVLGAAETGSLAGGKKHRRKLRRAVERFEELVDAGDALAARELVDELAERHGSEPVVRLMRRQLGPTPGSAKTMKNGPRNWRESVQQRRESVTRVYPVADLVVPIPATVSVGFDRDEHRSAVGVEESIQPSVDFDTLTNLLRTTISPEDWKNWNCTVQSVEKTLSLVIRAPQDVHEEIADLFEQLRRLHDLQVSLEIRHVVVPDRVFALIGVDFDVQPRAGGHSIVPISLPPQLDEDGETLLSPTETRQLMEIIQADVASDTLQAPKITLFNGQTARVTIGPEVGHLFRTVVSSDRRSINLLVARDVDDVARVLASARHVRLPDGHTLVVDQGTHTVTRIESTPVLNKVPYVSRLFKNTGSVQEMRHLMLITPRVVVVEEEEAIHSVPVIDHAPFRVHGGIR